MALLRVAVDARPLTSSRAGVATYCRGLVHGLRVATGSVDLRFYAKDPPPSDMKQDVHAEWRAMPAPLWLPLAVPRALQAGQVDVFHGTNHMIPPITAVPCVVTIHDLSALTMPTYHTWRNRLLSVPQMLLSLRHATRIITDAHATARALERVPGVNADRIRVIPLAPTPGLAPATHAQVREVTHRLALPETFVLFLGAMEPRKNLVTLVQALVRLHATGYRHTHLVIAGVEGWRNEALWTEVQRHGLANTVRFVGYVAPRDLPALYGAATVFAYPSLCEGFGLPPLEAMVCGAPVVTSNISSLPEVVGDAALLVDPRSPAELAAALRRLLDDADLREQLRVEGRNRAAQFSWERTAHLTLEVYREAKAAGKGQAR